MKLTKEDKIAIHCPTLELAEKVNEKLAKKSGKEELPKNLLNNKNGICLDIYDEEKEYTTVTHARKEWYEQEGYTIISAEQYLNIPTELKIEPFTKEEVFKEKQLIDYLSIGDKVYSITKGWGKVIALDKEYEVTSIKVEYNNEDIYCYHGDGKYHSYDLYPELYLEEVKLPKQELPEFKKGDLVWASDDENVWYVGFFINKDEENKYVSFKSDLSNIHSAKYCKPFNEIQISK